RAAGAEPHQLRIGSRVVSFCAQRNSIARLRPLLESGRRLHPTTFFNEHREAALRRYLHGRSRAAPLPHSATPPPAGTRPSGVGPSGARHDKQRTRSRRVICNNYKLCSILLTLNFACFIPAYLRRKSVPALEG